MVKQNILRGLKALIILLLMIAISMLVIIRWQSDFIIEKVLSNVQHELVDSLRYTTADMNWFSHFPLMSIRVYDLSVGSTAAPFIHNSDIDVVIGIWPLLKNEILVKKLGIRDGAISIKELPTGWSYEIFKKKEKDPETPYATKVNQLIIENTTLYYSDKASDLISLFIVKGVFKGSMLHDVLETSLSLESTLNELINSEYSLPAPFHSVVTGNYTLNTKTGEQQFDGFKIDHDAVQLSLSGSLARDTMAMNVQWKKAIPEKILTWLPKVITEKTAAFQVNGFLDGQADLTGLLSQKNTMNIQASTSLKNGRIHFLRANHEIKGIDVNVAYHSNRQPELSVSFKTSGRHEPKFSGSIHLRNFRKPVYDITFDGTIPATLFNLAETPGLTFTRGTLSVHHLNLKQISPGSFSFNTLFQHTIETIHVNDIQVRYHDQALAIDEASFRLKDQKADITIDQLIWNKAIITEVNSTFNAEGSTLDYNFSGALSEGAFSTTGTIDNAKHRSVITGSAEFKHIKMDQLLRSFSNFDQTFITDQNLSGQTNVWTQYHLPFDGAWNLLSKQMVVKSAIDIRDGRLKGMQTLEEFSRFVDLDDLKDIRFNQMRNYMLIEHGKVFLPVMFIQTNALNLSISGQHGFDEQIIYFLKLNAGQVAAKKLRKKKGGAEYVKASKSGWINMYFALEGTTQDVSYRQYKKAVISGFEQSALIKETLRDELVAQFGYDVYWLEPNEWEDIPEYR